VKRWDTLIIPYLAWSTIISVWLIISEWGQDDVILEHLYSGWKGGSQQSIYWMAAWFITTLAAATILRRFLERFGPFVVWGVAVAGMATSYVFARLVKTGVLETHPLVDTPLRLGLAWPVLFYLLVGELLRNILMPLVHKFSSHLLALFGVVLVAVGLGVTYNTNIRAHYIQAGDFGTVFWTPLVAIMITAGFILVFATWINAALLRSMAAQTVVSRLVRTGTTVVFLHGLVL